MLERFDHANSGLVIINFAGTEAEESLVVTETIQALRNKWWKSHSNNEPCILIDGFELTTKQYIKNCADLFKPSDKIKIYIFSHGHYFSDDAEKIKLTVSDITQALADFIGKQPVVVNLIICSAARGTVGPDPHTEREKSLAARLHISLYDKMHRDIPVVARTQIVSISAVDGRKKTFKNYLTREEILKHRDVADYNKKNTVSQQPGSKVIFSMDADNQIQDDAYLLKKASKWKEKVLALLQEVIETIESPEKKDQFSATLSSCRMLPPREVYQRLCELKLEETFGEKLKVKTLGFFLNYPLKSLNDQIAAGKKIFSGKHEEAIEHKILKRMDF